MRIDWKGPYRLAQVLEMRDDQDDCGLYQIYGHHVVFGAKSLLYVGKVTEQTFATRFKQHQAEWLHEDTDVWIHVGRIDKRDYKKEQESWSDWTTIVTDAESLLIYWHSPPYNSQGLSKYDGQELRVQNRGERGSMLPESSSDWRPARPVDSADEKQNGS
ncbi:MAG: hypothetical protein GY722_00170 [bacterium]|nr:hypothetical protein [bacterium]